MATEDMQPRRFLVRRKSDGLVRLLNVRVGSRNALKRGRVKVCDRAIAELCPAQVRWGWCKLPRLCLLLPGRKEGLGCRDRKAMKPLPVKGLT